jgi:uncharacterized protein
MPPHVKEWQPLLEEVVKTELSKKEDVDGSHDFGHIFRVSHLALKFAYEEKANPLVVFTAGMLHDIVCLPKNAPDANKSSLYASERAKEMLDDLSFPEMLIPNVCHAVHAHSFSAKVETKTIEAMCVQDADRMEALGAFGLMRVFYCAGLYGSKILDENDPEALNRELNDQKFALDHFVKKLFTLHGTMKTEAGKKTALSLTRFLQEYREALIDDYNIGNHESGRFKIAHIYRDAGEKKRSLLCAEDPFAEHGRKLDTGMYALDHLIKNDDPYIKAFLDQLRYELDGYR